MQYLRHSTAGQEISLGQFLDSTDGNTEEGGLTIANTDIKLRKHGTTTLANKNSGGATVISNGVYQTTLDATDTDTLGMVEIYVHVSGALAVKNTYSVLPASVFDAMFVDALTGPYPKLGISESGVAQAAAATTIQLRSASFFADDEVIGATVFIISAAAGAGQSRIITDYANSTDTATVDQWKTTPTGTISYMIIPTPPSSTASPVEANVVSLDDDVITAAKIADDAFANEHFAAAALTSSEVTSVGSVDNLSVGSGGIATIATSDSTVTTGTETQTYAVTAALDGSYHDVAVDTSIDMYYQFNVGSSGVPISVDWVGYANTNNDNIEVYFYNYTTSGVEQVGTIVGTSANTVQNLSFTATTDHVGQGANIGEVQIYFKSSGADVATNISTDRVTCSYTQAVSGVSNGSTVTLAATTANTNLAGYNWTLALGGQDISGSYVRGASVTGVSSGATAATFEDCVFGATATLPPGTYLRCGFSGTFTGASDGEFLLIDCYSAVAGSGSPAFVFSGLASATGINNRRWVGGSTYTLDTDCTLSHEVLVGGGTTITPADAAVEVRGQCRSLTLALADTDVGNTIQVMADVGAVTITSAGSGDSATVNIWGVQGALTDGSSAGTTVTQTLSDVNTAEINSKDVTGAGTSGDLWRG